MDGHHEPTPTPTRMWFSLLRRLGRGLAGRRICVRDTAFTVVSMHGKPDGRTNSCASSSGAVTSLRAEVTGDALRFTPTAVITPLGRWSSWGVLPSGTTASPELPGELRITEITTADDAVVVRSGLDRWAASQADRPRLRELLDAGTQDRLPSRAVSSIDPAA